MSRLQRRASRPSVLFAALVLLAVLAVLGWSLWPSRTELSQDSYDLAIALYRTCNLQDREGLEQIQTNLDELHSGAAANDPAVASLQRIVDEAQAGDWKTAMQKTRNVLEDQVR